MAADDDEFREDEFREELISRMKKVEGQARGIQRMIAEGRSCSDVIVQLGAIKSAIDQVAVGILAHYMAECIEKERSRGKDTSAAIKEFMPVFRRFA